MNPVVLVVCLAILAVAVGLIAGTWVAEAIR